MWSEFRETRENPKDEAWRKAREEIDRIVDKLGKPVDPGIKETVVALRVLGLSTDASCEGHLDKQLKAPWVDVGHVPQEVRDRVREADKLRNEGKVKEDIEKLRRETWMRILGEEARLMELLDEFYRDRNVPFQRRLIVKCWSDTARLMSQGAEMQDLYPAEIQKGKLTEYQEELASFTRFLKEKFLSEV